MIEKENNYFKIFLILEKKLWHFIFFILMIVIAYHYSSTQNFIKENIKNLPSNLAEIIKEKIPKKTNSININFGKLEKLEDLFLYQHAQSYSTTITLLGVVITLTSAIFALFQYFNLKEKEQDFQKLVEQGEKKLLEQNMLTFELLNLTNSIISKLEKPENLQEVLRNFFDKITNINELLRNKVIENLKTLFMLIIAQAGLMLQ